MPRTGPGRHRRRSPARSASRGRSPGQTGRIGVGWTRYCWRPGRGWTGARRGRHRAADDRQSPWSRCRSWEGPFGGGARERAVLQAWASAIWAITVTIWSAPGRDDSAAVLRWICLLYTSDAADEEDSVDLG